MIVAENPYKTPKFNRQFLYRIKYRIFPVFCQSNIQNNNALVLKQKSFCIIKGDNGHAFLHIRRFCDLRIRGNMAGMKRDFSEKNFLSLNYIV
jgi:hypothetical protein